MKAKKDTLIDRSASLMDEVKALKKEIEEMKKAEISKGSGSLLEEAKDVNGIKLIAKEFADYSINDLRGLSDQIKADNKGVAMVFAAVSGGKVTFLVSLTDDLVEQGLHAGKMIKVQQLLAAVAAAKLTWHRQVQRIRLRFQRRLPRPKS